MRVTQRTFRAIAATAFVLSLIVHVLASAGIALPWGKAPFLLHLVIFLVWIPTIIVLVGEKRGRIGWEQVLEVLRPAPRWFRFTTWFVISYSVLNFALLWSGAVGDSKDELVGLRAISCVWMVAYWLALVFLRRPL